MRAEFTDDLITGNELIDSQHEELIGRINKLLDSCEAGEGKISAIKMLDYLAKYTDTHFGDEEALQKEDHSLSDRLRADLILQTLCEHTFIHH